MVLLCASRYLPAERGRLDIGILLPSSPIPNFAPRSSSSRYFKSKTQLKLCRSRNKHHQQNLEGFSALKSDLSWKSGSVWSTMALYFFSLHIPMSFGGLPVFAHTLNQPNLEPQIRAVAVLVIQTLELFSALLLLQYTAKPHYKAFCFFKPNELSSERNWMFTALMGFVFLIIAISFTSFLTNAFDGTKDVNNPILKEILLSGSVSQTACTLVYCIVSPLLEEIVYRGFLVTCLAASMQWYQAVVISSVIFSAAHLSGENFVQLFIIGLVLGCSYCWTGELRSSILLHSMYNALTLVITSLA